ncbi:hypothetical protein KEM56_000239 [Ascosphaera pollenicola]|nr:hypothetical protein KEM56_000239 [Ascosphaera pollenicola]
MAHPRAINSLLIFFTLIAFASSTALALLDADAPAIREHYAHSPSVVVTLAIFHHIFYSSAISVDWPRILVSFWSNYSWLAGMIRIDGMQHSISRVTGSRARDLIKLGSSPAGFSDSMTGGYELREIYDLGPPPPNAKRNINEDFHIESSTIDKGFPLPGNYTGLPGALSIEGIASANAFLTSFIWFLIIFAILIGSIYTTKFILELFVGTGVISENRFSTFRKRWRLYTHGVLGRLLWCGFYMLIFSTTFQLSLNGRAGIVFLAVVVFLLISGCVFAIVYHAIFAALKDTERETCSAGDNIKFLLVNSWADLRFCGFRIRLTPINHDPEYLREFGWLSARFRQERWWWFAATFAYDFLRGCILGGASDNPFGQIFVSLALEILMFAWSIWMKPYEATRLNILAVYLLGFSKVLTVGLSVAFHPRLSVPRITTTVIGVFIIIIQGLLTVAAIALIVFGIVSTHLSRRRRNASNRSSEAVSQVSEDYLGRRYLTRVEEPLTHEGQNPSNVVINTREET